MIIRIFWYNILPVIKILEVNLSSFLEMIQLLQKQLICFACANIVEL